MPANADRPAARRGRERSLSGFALMLGLRGRTPGLAHHAITFPADYDAEFDDVFGPAAPCASRRSTSARRARRTRRERRENWFVLVNAPPIGDAPTGRAEAERLIDRLGVRDRIAARAPRGRPATSSARPAPPAARSTARAARAAGDAAAAGERRARHRAGCGWPAGRRTRGGGLPLVALERPRSMAREIGRREARAPPCSPRCPLALLRPPAAAAAEGARGDTETRRRRPADGDDHPAATSTAGCPSSIFLHGWGATRPRYYRPWLEHLAREGNAVIYPRYQESVVEPPPQVLGNVLAGVRLRSARSTRTAARSWSPATPRAARSPPTTPRSPAAPSCRRRARCSARTRAGGCAACRSRCRRSTGTDRGDDALVALAGTRDEVVGSRPPADSPGSRAPAARSLVVVSDPAASDHLGPQRRRRRRAAGVLGAAGPVDRRGASNVNGGW